MTWVSGKPYQLSFSVFPRLCGIKDGWVVQLFIDKLTSLDVSVFKRKTEIINPYKILIKEKTGSNRLKLLHVNGIKKGDIIKLDIDVPEKIEFTTYFEIIDIIPENNEIILNRKILHKIDLTFIEKSNLTGIYYFNFIPDKPGMYNFQISNPKYFIKPFGYAVEVKEKLFLQELIETYTSELKKKFNIKPYDPQGEIQGVEDPIWFNKVTGKVWVWNGKEWITAD
jgi:hypothetical protein